MKKYIAIVLLLVMIFSLTSCDVVNFVMAEKKEYSGDEFIDILEDEDFEVAEVDLSEEQAEIMDVCIGAEKDDLLVTFFIYEDKDLAESAFDDLKNDLGEDDEVKSQASINLQNYSQFRAETKDQIHVVINVGETLLLIDAPKEDNKEVGAFIKRLGY
jgi:uncharacterized lipoprotein YehR (DUF1307 family)